MKPTPMRDTAATNRSEMADSVGERMYPIGPGVTFKSFSRVAVPNGEREAAAWMGLRSS